MTPQWRFVPADTHSHAPGWPWPTSPTFVASLAHGFASYPLVVSMDTTRLDDEQTDRFMGRLAVWCAGRAMRHIANPQARRVARDALRVASRYARGEATRRELYAASYAPSHDDFGWPLSHTDSFALGAASCAATRDDALIDGARDSVASASRGAAVTLGYAECGEADFFKSRASHRASHVTERAAQEAYARRLFDAVARTPLRTANRFTA